MCECIDKLDKALAEHNTTLDLAFMLNPKTGDVRQSLKIAASKLNRSDKRRPRVVLPAYCPFCGEKIETEAVKDLAEAE